MKNSNFYKNSILALLPISLCVGIAFGCPNKLTDKVDAYEFVKLTTMDVNLNDTAKDNVRNYYSNLNTLTDAERKGTNLLKNLKPILKNNQKYFSYDSGDSIWKIYEIVDRDWAKSPAASVKNGTYDANSNTILNYQFGKTEDEYNPYLHALYVDRAAENNTRAWGDHTQTGYGINREHIWPKSHGFDNDYWTKSDSGGARGDPMHLWAGNGRANNIHNNYFYGNVDTDKTYTNTRDEDYPFLGDNLLGTSKTVGSGKVFEPQDSDKGDIARAVFYMAARYNNYAGSLDIDVNDPNLIIDNNINLNTGTSTYDNPFNLGVLSDLLEWNKIDPPDEFEIHRNNLLFNNFTNNRNPFIDFPDWADICFGTSTKAADPTKDDINGKKDGEVVLSSISLSGNYKTSFNLGEEFSSQGLVVTAHYSDNTSREVTPTSIEGYKKDSKGEQTITITYKENGKSVSTTYTVNVKEDSNLKTVIIVGCIVGAAFLSILSTTVSLKKKRKKGKRKNGRK